ncbi:hypothetical protein [Streptosporangium sp. NPDC087985]
MKPAAGMSTTETAIMGRTARRYRIVWGSIPVTQLVAAMSA